MEKTYKNLINFDINFFKMNAAMQDKYLSKSVGAFSEIIHGLVNSKRAP